MHTTAVIRLARFIARVHPACLVVAAECVASCKLKHTIFSAKLLCETHHNENWIDNCDVANNAGEHARDWVEVEEIHSA